MVSPLTTFLFGAKCVLCKDRQLQLPQGRFLCANPEFEYMHADRVNKGLSFNSATYCSLGNEQGMLGVEKIPSLNTVAEEQSSQQHCDNLIMWQTR